MFISCFNLSIKLLNIMETAYAELSLPLISHDKILLNKYFTERPLNLLFTSSYIFSPLYSDILYFKKFRSQSSIGLLLILQTLIA
jgi:hypothetical protein